MTPKGRALLTRLEGALRENEEPAPSAILAQLAGVPKQAVEELLGDREQRSIVLLGPAGWALHEWVMAVFGGIQVTFADDPFGPKDVRQELGITRRVVMDLLDFLAREGFLERTSEGWRCLVLPLEAEEESR